MLFMFWPPAGLTVGVNEKLRRRALFLDNLELA